MRSASTPEAEQGTTRAPELLVAAAAHDWLYADLYLERAEALLAPLLSRETWAASRARVRALADLGRALRRAALAGDWARLRELSALALDRGRGAEASQRDLAVADTVYGPRNLQLTPHTRALAGGDVEVPDGQDARGMIEGLRAGLLELAGRDPEEAPFYWRRAEELEAIDLVEAPTGRARGPSLDELRRRILEAISHKDLSGVQSLARAAQEAAEAQQEAGSGEEDPGAREDWGSLSLTRVESRALPAEVCGRAERLGLEPQCLPEHEGARSRLLHRVLGSGSERRALWANLDLLRARPFVTSGGGRYLPGFASEWLLVEGHSEREGAEGDEPGPLVEQLGLARRRGLSRARIDDALLRRGPGIVRGLGLDPAEHRLVCVPFDAYLRLAPKLEWGHQARWTHLDGYQIGRDGHLLSLAGGNVRYGGAEDLCSLPLHYASEAMDLRLAVVQRARLAHAVR